jgi:hypothetical protein
VKKRLATYVALNRWGNQPKFNARTLLDYKRFIKTTQILKRLYHITAMLYAKTHNNSKKNTNPDHYPKGT